MKYLQRLLAQSLEGINWMLDQFSKEARPYIELLGAINEQYCASLNQLTERLQAQRGWDLEV